MSAKPNAKPEQAVVAIDDDRHDDLSRLLAIMARLRGPDGCPWDREQNFSTIAPYTIEEAYEVADAVSRNNLTDLREELGDLLLQVVFHAQMASEQNAFSFQDVARGIADKMIARHPHVFGASKAADAAAVKDIWEAQKEAEKTAKPQNSKPDSVLDDVPLNHPALMRAQKISKRAARAGFEWPDVMAVFDKLDEERAELIEAMSMPKPRRDTAVAEELGDLLFVVVNIARHLNVDAEEALRQANFKFEKRFRNMEQSIARSGKNLNSASMDEMQSAWDDTKRTERN